MFQVHDVELSIVVCFGVNSDNRCRLPLIQPTPQFTLAANILRWSLEMVVVQRWNHNHPRSHSPALPQRKCELFGYSHLSSSYPEPYPAMVQPKRVTSPALHVPIQTPNIYKYLHSVYQYLQSPTFILRRMNVATTTTNQWPPRVPNWWHGRSWSCLLCTTLPSCKPQAEMGSFPPVTRLITECALPVPMYSAPLNSPIRWFQSKIT